MGNSYRAESTRAKAIYGEDIFDAEFTAADEGDQLVSDLAIVPRAYEVLSDNYTAGKKGEVVELALPVEIEAALVSGGHLERAEKKPAAKKKPASGA